MASTAAEILTNNHSGSSRTPRVRVVKGGRYGLSKARQFARTAGTVLVIAIFLVCLPALSPARHASHSFPAKLMTPSRN